MYLIVDQLTDQLFYVFSLEDPRVDGYAGELRAPVQFEGHPDPRQWRCFGVSNQDGASYRAFASAKDCQSADYAPLAARPCLVNRWSQYQRTASLHGS